MVGCGALGLGLGVIGTGKVIGRKTRVQKRGSARCLQSFLGNCLFLVLPLVFCCDVGCRAAGNSWFHSPVCSGAAVHHNCCVSGELPLSCVHHSQDKRCPSDAGGVVAWISRLADVAVSMHKYFK